MTVSKRWLFAIFAAAVTGLAIGAAVFMQEQDKQQVPLDIEQCVNKAPPGSKINFTRNANGSSVCQYEMKPAVP